MPLLRDLEYQCAVPGETAEPDRHALRRNLLLVGFIAASLLFAAYYEGYLGLITIPFWGVLLGGIAMAIWLAFTESTVGMLALVLAVFMIEYAKEAIGIRYGFWTYHGTNGAFILGIWSWVLAGISCYVAATRVVEPRLRRLLPRASGRVSNPVVLLIVAAVGVVLLRDQFSNLGWLFWSFYGMLLLFTALRSGTMELSLFVSLVIVSWVVGNISEYTGSVASGIWTFTGHPNYPPIFLLFACWPIEIVAQYSLASLFVPLKSQASRTEAGEGI